MSAVSDANEHVCFKFDAVEVIGSGAYAGIVLTLFLICKHNCAHRVFTLQASDKLRASIDSSVMSKLGSPEFLKCHCNDSKCIGAVIPAIGKHCPAGDSLGLTISMKNVLIAPWVE